MWSNYIQVVWRDTIPASTGEPNTPSLCAHSTRNNQAPSDEPLLAPIMHKTRELLYNALTPGIPHIVLCSPIGAPRVYKKISGSRRNNCGSTMHSSNQQGVFSHAVHVHMDLVYPICVHDISISPALLTTSQSAWRTAAELTPSYLSLTYLAI